MVNLLFPLLFTREVLAFHQDGRQKDSFFAEAHDDLLLPHRRCSYPVTYIYSSLLSLLQ